MDKIATKTKIALWCVVGDKEKIDFHLCDFSPDQVAALDRIVRAKDDKVRLTLAPEQKKLQIAPLEATVRIVSLACRSGGQKIKIADFKSPDSRAEALKRLSGAETPILLTLEPVQGHLPFPEPAVGDEDKGPSIGELVGRSYNLQLKGLRKCTAWVCAEQEAGQWHGSYRASMGNYQIESSVGEIIASTRADALTLCLDAMTDWLDGLTLAAKADRQRRITMDQKIKAELGLIIDEAKREDADPDS